MITHEDRRMQNWRLWIGDEAEGSESVGVKTLFVNGDALSDYRLTREIVETMTKLLRKRSDITRIFFCEELFSENRLTIGEISCITELSEVYDIGISITVEDSKHRSFVMLLDLLKKKGTFEKVDLYMRCFLPYRASVFHGLKSLQFGVGMQHDDLMFNRKASVSTKTAQFEKDERML